MTNEVYQDFVLRKLAYRESIGIDDKLLDERDLFPHQVALVRWALRKGASAIFADTGLGKTRMQLKWADAVHRATGSDVLILAPLAVAEQTREEGARIGINVTHARGESDVRPALNIINYERLHCVDTSRFGAVVLDESSRIKHEDSKTLAMLMDAFRDTPYRLCATATPAPNDWTELGTHAQFLGVCTVSEMLAEFFVHDGGETQVWRLKGHAREIFWRWVASWGAMIQSPADLGFDASAYDLPTLHTQLITVASDAKADEGSLFAMEAQTLSERRQAKRDSLIYRVSGCVNLVHSEWTKLANSDKLADPNTTGYANGLEERVRREQEKEVRGRPEIQGKKKRSERERQGSAKGVHEGVLQTQSREIRQENAGATRQIQRGATQEICGRQGIQGGAQVKCQGVASGKPGKAQAAKSIDIRDRPERLPRHASNTEREMRNLRLLGHEQPKNISSCGSLPQDWESQRAALSELQSGAREVQRRPKQPSDCDSVSLTPYLIWCELNDEQNALEKAFGDLAFSVRGSDKPEVKEDRIIRWMRQERPIMISKAKIMGWGLNLQFCNNMIFLGATDSFEGYYQAVRRCWRFGQTRPVNVYIFASEFEGAILRNLQRKEQDAKAMFRALSAETAASVRDEVMGMRRQSNEYAPTRSMALPGFIQDERRTSA